MPYLLDTVALVMWWGDAPQLGGEARAVMEATDGDLFLSCVSIWEIANKNRIGKLPQFDGFAGRFATLMREGNFRLLDLSGDHAMRAGYLPGPHRDPFDRLLAAQALCEDMTIITNDPAIAGFGCKVLW